MLSEPVLPAAASQPIAGASALYKLVNCKRGDHLWIFSDLIIFEVVSGAFWCNADQLSEALADRLFSALCEIAFEKWSARSSMPLRRPSAPERHEAGERQLRCRLMVPGHSGFQRSEEWRRLRRHAPRAVTVTAIGPDGTRVVTGSQDSTAKILDVSRSETIGEARAVLLAAALARRIGQRTAPEAHDLLMKTLPDDDLLAAGKRPRRHGPASLPSQRRRPVARPGADRGRVPPIELTTGLALRGAHGPPGRRSSRSTKRLRPPA